MGSLVGTAVLLGVVLSSPESASPQAVAPAGSPSDTMGPSSIVPAALSPAGSRGAARFYTNEVLTLTLTDGTRVKGRLSKLTHIPVEQYEPRYERWRATSPSGANMPALGERVTLGGTGMSAGGVHTFGGFACEGICVRKGKNSSLHTIEFSEFTVLTVRKSRIGISALQGLRAIERLPVLSALEVQTSDGAQVVAVDDLAWVETADGKNRASGPLSQFAPAGTNYIGSFQMVGLVADSDASFGGVVLAHSRLRPLAPGFEARLSLGYLGALLDFDLAYPVSLGDRMAVVPLLGVGVANGWVLTGNAGAALLTDLVAGVGLRVDYAAYWLWAGQENVIDHSVRIGPSWGMRGWRRH